jgi:hypothetical protein
MYVDRRNYIRKGYGSSNLGLRKNETLEGFIPSPQ